jgi:hypothetical protein
MSEIKFSLEKRPDRVGVLVDTIVRTEISLVGGKVEEEWGTIQDLDNLFQACRDRWEGAWDLNKVCTAIRESMID